MLLLKKVKMLSYNVDMAYSSYYWKQIIKRDVRLLDKKLQLSHAEIEKDLDKHFSDIEIKIMTLAYIVRKMADTHKLPDVLTEEELKIKVYSRNKGFQRRTYIDISEEYNLENSSSTKFRIRKICNQIIHSYLIQAVGTRKKAFKYVWFVSEGDKDKGLYQMTIKDFLRLLLKIANSQIRTVHATYNEENGEWIYARS